MKGTKVKRLVLDTSAIKGTSRLAFEACEGRYEFLVSENLFVELFTHREKKEAFSKDHAALKTFEYIKKTASIPILTPDDPVRFEVEEGRSARECPHKELGIPSDLFGPSDAELARVREREKFLGTQLDFKHPPECDVAYQELRRMNSDKELWPRIAEILNNVDLITWVRDRCVTSLMETADRQGWKVSNNFCPDREWLTFGAELVRAGYMFWKYARHGDDVPQPSSPANPTYDMLNVAHMAICDGLLSAEKTMLNIAWACWPEKRDSLVTYDQSKKAIVPYEPSWQKS